MIKFNIEKFLIDFRISKKQLAEKLNLTREAIHYACNRLTIKLQTLKELENCYGDLSSYILEAKLLTKSRKI